MTGPPIPLETDRRNAGGVKKLGAGVFVLLLASCGSAEQAEPQPQVNVFVPEPPPGPEVRSNESAQSAQPEQDVPEPIDFASDVYLQDACRGLLDLPLRRFESHDFVYDSPLPVKVSGEYHEVRGRRAADADTVYEEIEGTIFRNVEIVVEADQTAPHFSFDRWAVPFAVSAYPFSAHRQLKHRRAMGSDFPFFDLANLETGQPDSSTFSRNFISVLNFLATRGENMWGRGNGFEERERARELRSATTATESERPLRIANDDLAALRRIPPGESLSLHSLGPYLLISLGRPARFIAAIDASEDAVGLRACDGNL